MSDTWKNEKCGTYWWKNPGWWRKLGNRMYRARWRQRMREGRYGDLGHPKRDKRGWYW